MKLTKNGLINEIKPDPRIGWVYDLNMKCTRPTEFCSSCVCTNMGFPMHEKISVFKLPLYHVYYVRISLVNGKVCTLSQLLVKAWNNQY